MDSKTVFELRNEARYLEGASKLDKLNEALKMAQQLIENEPYDEWVQKALAYSLIDLCKYYIQDKNITQAAGYYNSLLAIQFQCEDDIIENQKSFLRPKIDINYSEVQKAEELSKSGNHQGALNIFKKLISENRLIASHHEAYGWIIYRYIKDMEAELTSVEVRTYLKDYMNLKNERPSMLHSMILNFGVNYSKDHIDFNLYNFFKLWEPSNLRDEDKKKQHYNGKDVPSLVTRMFREFIEKDITIDINYLISNVKLDWHNCYSNAQRVLDLLREPFFWKLFNYQKENNLLELWNAFNKYNQLFSRYEKSKWHSDILSFAERVMIENEEWRFLDFFKNWNPENLLDEDWKEIKKEDKLYKPLAIKCLKKAYEIIKTQPKEFTDSWLLPIYSKAVDIFPDDEWLLREHAILLIKNNDLELAKSIYRKLILELGDKSYIWKEFSSCYNADCDLKIGMLSKAVQLEKNEDFLGDIHLELAKTFLENGMIENCIVELNSYKQHRDVKGWKLSELFIELSDRTKNQKTNLKDNKNAYGKYIPIAEQNAYKDIEWTEVILVDKWINGEGREKVTFTNGNTIDFSIRSNRFPQLQNATLGNVFKFKLHRQEIKKEVDAKYPWMEKTIVIEYKYIPLIIEKSDKPDWSILNDIYAIVEYINIEKKVIHAITTDNKEVFFPQNAIKLQIGDIIRAKYFKKKIKDEIRLELMDIIKIEKEQGVVNFPKIIAIIDSVNKEKNLFHFVGNSSVQGIVKLNETKIIAEEGKFLELFYITKKDKKHNKTIYKAIEVRETDETSSNLLKKVNGHLDLKYKIGDSTMRYYEMNEDGINNVLPDFGFVENIYVPKNVLIENNITSNCYVSGEAIFTGDNWKIFKLDEINSDI